MTTIALRRVARPIVERYVISGAPGLSSRLPTRSLLPPLAFGFSFVSVQRAPKAIAAEGDAVSASHVIDVPEAPSKRAKRKTPKQETASDEREQTVVEATTEPAPIPEPPSLRPYQSEAINACLSGLARGLRRIGVSSPTGSGKTVMFMSLIPQVQHLDRNQVLIIVGSVELALQAEAAANRVLGPGYTVEVEQARRVASGRADVTIATYQTLNNAERLGKFDPDRFKLVIVDEAHHAAALSYLRLLHYFNDQVTIPTSTGPFSTFDHGNRVPIIGFSATFTRHDQLALSAAFEEIVFHREVSHMLQEGWLSAVKSTSVHAELKLNDVGVNAKGDYNASSLAKHVNTPATNSLIVRTWLHAASTRRSTLVFAVNLRHVAALVDEFRKAGVDARSISAHTDPKLRKDTIATFAAGEFPVLVNCEVLTEGTDIREIDCIVLARPTKSKNLLAQMVGRGLRLSPESGKEDCYILDIEDNISKASGMRVDPTLFGLSYEDGAARQAGLSELSGRANEYEEDDSRPDEDNVAPRSVGRVTLVDNGDPFAFEDATKENTNTPLALMTYNSWVSCGNNRFVLELMEDGFLSIQKSKQKWSIAFTERLPPELFNLAPDRRPVSRSPFRAKKQLAEADTLQRALQTADKFGEQRLGFNVAKVLARSASWRTRPASEKQVQLLLKLRNAGVRADAGGEVDVDAGAQEVSILGRTISVKDLTAGHVATFVTALKHGAAGAQKKKDKAAARMEEQELRRQRNEAEHAARNLRLPGV